jgi:hypothetical protein
MFSFISELMTRTDRGGPQNISLLPFNYLMQVQAGGYFIEFSRCESFKLNI